MKLNNASQLSNICATDEMQINKYILTVHFDDSYNYIYFTTGKFKIQSKRFGNALNIFVFAYI